MDSRTLKWDDQKGRGTYTHLPAKLFPELQPYKLILTIFFEM